MDADLRHRLERLEGIFQGMGSVLVAFSGGADSALVLKVAHRTLGVRAAAVTSVSPTLPPAELDDSRRIALQIGAAHHLIESRVVSDPAFFENGPDRCYTCKHTLYTDAARLARRLGFRWIANGTNLDDFKDIRPGLRAASEHGIRSPLAEAEFSKQEVRRLSRALGLDTWDKPAEACLSSRVPFGTLITVDNLSQIEAAEAALKQEGFRQVRVRHHGEIARLEFSEEDMARLADPSLRMRIAQIVKRAGFRYVATDLEGYRQGSLNPEPLTGENS